MLTFVHGWETGNLALESKGQAGFQGSFHHVICTLQIVLNKNSQNFIFRSLIYLYGS